MLDNLSWSSVYHCTRNLGRMHQQTTIGELGVLLNCHTGRLQVDIILMVIVCLLGGLHACHTDLMMKDKYHLGGSSVSAGWIAYLSHKLDGQRYISRIPGQNGVSQA